MDWTEHAGLSERWQSLTRGHACVVNARLREGRFDATASTGDDRETLAEELLDLVRRANNEGGEGVIDELRRRFAPAHAPFARRAHKQGLGVGTAMMLDDGRFVFVVGSPWQRPQAWLATTGSTEPLLGVFAVGRAPGGRVHALGRSDGIHLTDGWGGRVLRVLAWPSTYAPALPDMPVPTLEGRPLVARLIPFDDGARAVVVSRSGVFVASPDGSALIHPSARDLDQYVDEDGDDAFPLDLGAVHAALSPRQDLLVVGDQASLHRVVRDDGASVAAILPVDGHPQNAEFSTDGSRVALSSRAGDHGRTVYVPSERLTSDPQWYASPAGEPVGMNAVMTASRAQPDAFVFGAIDGFVRLTDGAGALRGVAYAGAAVTALDFDQDSQRLLVGTSGGIVHLFDLKTDADPFAIGTVPHREHRRWIFWRSEPGPLIW